MLSQLVVWYCLDTPKKILQGWKNLLRFNLEYFSIVLLLRTFFAPWRQYEWDYGRGFDLQRYFYVLSSNLISRGLGMIVRTIFIAFGSLIELLIFLAGLAVLTGWFLLPLLLIWMSALDIRTMLISLYKSLLLI